MQQACFPSHAGEPAGLLFFWSRAWRGGRIWKLNGSGLGLGQVCLEPGIKGRHWSNLLFCFSCSQPLRKTSCSHLSFNPNTFAIEYQSHSRNFSLALSCTKKPSACSPLYPQLSPSSPLRQGSFTRPADSSLHGEYINAGMKGSLSAFERKIWTFPFIYLFDT